MVLLVVIAEFIYCSCWAAPPPKKKILFLQFLAPCTFFHGNLPPLLEACVSWDDHYTYMMSSKQQILWRLENWESSRKRWGQQTLWTAGATEKNEFLFIWFDLTIQAVSHITGTPKLGRGTPFVGGWVINLNWWQDLPLRFGLSLGWNYWVKGKLRGVYHNCQQSQPSRRTPSSFSTEQEHPVVGPQRIRGFSYCLQL